MRVHFRLGMYLCLSVLSWGCERGDRLTDSARRGVESGLPPEARDASRSIPAISCVEILDTEDAAYVELAGVLPEDVRAMPGRNDGYLPGGLADVAFTQDGSVLVLDGQLQRVWAFSADLGLIGSWGARGVGPHDLREAAALTVDPVDGTVLIAETGPPGIARFTDDGKLIRRRPIATTPSDIVVGAGRTVYVSHDPFLPRLRSASFPVVTRFTSDLQPIDTLRSVTRESFGRRPYLTTEVAVRLGADAAGDVVVAFPFTNDLSWYRAGRPATHIAGCVPVETMEAYEEAELDQPGGEAVHLITDARPFDSNVAVVSTLRTAHERYQIVRYGEISRSATLMPTSPVRLPTEARFVAEDELIVFSRSGMIARLSVRGEQRQ